ncbi:MAG: hypothetical protein AAF624_15985 [Bacteroidota bacterium]
MSQSTPTPLREGGVVEALFSLRVPWTRVWQVGLVVAIVAPHVVGPSVGSVVVAGLGGALVLAYYFSVPRRLGGLLAPWALLLLIGSIGAMQHPTSDVLRDVWYIGKIPIVLGVGYLFAARIGALSTVLATYAVGALCLALPHVLQFVVDPSLLSLSTGTLRNRVGAGFVLTAFVPVVLWLARREGVPVLEKQPWLWKACVGLSVLSLILSFSRTYAICLILMALSPLFVRQVRAIRSKRQASVWRRAALVVLLLGVGVGWMQFAQQSNLVQFVDKVANSLVEITIQNQTDPEARNENWRGFEMYRAVRQYAEGSPVERLVGTGLGTKVDLGIRIPLGDRYFRYIPLLHNGYGMLLVKTGLIGAILYLLVFVQFLRRARHLGRRTTHGETRLAAMICVGCTLSVLLATLVISGLLNPYAMDAAGLLLGSSLFVLHSAEQARRDSTPAQASPSAAP